MLLFLLGTGIALPPSRVESQGASSADLWDLPPCYCVVFPCARKDAKDSGLTAVVDARKQPPSPTLYSALRSIQVCWGCSVGASCVHAAPVPWQLQCQPS